jgi:flagellin
MSSTINTNVTSLVAQRVLSKNSKQTNQSLERLSTGLKISSGKDDPAGLIAAQNLSSEQAGITTAVSNATRAGNIVSTAEGGLNEVSSLLTQLQGLVGQSANSGGLSSEEVAANQLQVDSILATVNRISGSTSFQGKQLLNGNYDYTTSGVSSTSIANLRVNSAAIPDGSTKAVVVNVTQSAQTAKITHTGTVGTGGVTISVAGNKGTQQLSFASGTTVTGIANAINGVKAATGLSAQISGTALRVNSTGYGSDAYVSITAVSGTFTTSTAKATGRDATLTVNGAAATAKGLDVTVRTSTLDTEFSLGSGINTTNGTSTFYVTGGGATFALGSKVSENNKASIGIANVSTGSLGNSTLGFLSTLGSGGANALTGSSLVNAQDIVSTAVKQVSQLRGRLGAFQKYTVDSTVNNLNVAYENASSALSAIQDTDFAAETSNLTRAQILSSASQTVLSQANAAPQSVLSLLR